jgi:hypothetical protein
MVTIGEPFPQSRIDIHTVGMAARRLLHEQSRAQLSAYPRQV